VYQHFDLLHQEFVGMINQEFKADGMQNGSFQRQDAFLEFEKLLTLGV